MHNEVFSGDEKHQTMDIKQYMEKPKLYVKPLCQNHQKELSMCCIDCYSMKCAACPINKDCRKKGKWVLWANGEISKPEIKKFTRQLRIFFHFGWKNYGSYMLAILLLGLFFQNLPIISRGIIYITLRSDFTSRQKNQFRRLSTQCGLHFLHNFLGICRITSVQQC